MTPVIDAGVRKTVNPYAERSVGFDQSIDLQTQSVGIDATQMQGAIDVLDLRNSHTGAVQQHVRQPVAARIASQRRPKIAGADFLVQSRTPGHPA